MTNKRGRPATYPTDMVVRIAPGEKPTKLQKRSQRRAVVDFVLDSGATTTLGEINEHFGFDARPAVLALLRNGWLEEVTR